MPARNSFGIEVSVTSPYRISGIDGGIRTEIVDLELRYGLEPPLGVSAITLIEDRILPLCNPRLAQEARQLGPVEALRKTRLIHTVKAQISWREWFKHNQIDQIDDTHGLRFDRTSMSLQAAVDGLGVVLETATLAQRELQAGDLAPMAPEFGAMFFPAYRLCCPPRHLNHRAVKKFADWIQGETEQHEKEKALLLTSLGCTKQTNYITDVLSKI